jgi:hypothetical protein
VHEAPTGWHILSTTGGQVDIWEGEGLVELLGVIDTADEALIVAQSRGYAVACYGEPNEADPDATQLAALPRTNGYEIWLNPSFDMHCGPTTRYRLHVSTGGQVTELSQETHSLSCPAPTPTPGRKPPGLLTMGAPSQQRAIGALLSRDAHYEAASVPAFEILAAELKMHGAPRSLRQRALSAAQDEVRHAEAMTKLANHFGSNVRSLDVKG